MLREGSFDVRYALDSGAKAGMIEGPQCAINRTSFELAGDRGEFDFAE